MLRREDSTRKYFLEDGTEHWYYVFRTGRGADGKRKSVLRRGFATQKLADSALRKAIAQYEKNKTVIENSATFGELFTEWLTEYGRAHWEPSTQESSQRRAAYALALWGTRKIGSLTTREIDLGLMQLKMNGGQKTATHPKGKPLSPKTCHAVYSILRQFFAQMVAWEKIEKNPMLGVKAPSGAFDSTVESLTPDEYNRLLVRVTNTRYYAMSILGSEGGMRCGELLALERPDVDFSNGDITVSKSLQQTKSHGLRIKKTKTNKIRIAQVSPETPAILLEHFKVIDRDRELLGSDYDDSHDLVFPSPSGGHLKPKQVSGRVSQFMKEAGIEKSLHKLRHFCASVRLSNGQSPVAVAAHLGHDPATLMRIYAHVLPGDRERGVSIWRQAIGAITKQKPQPPTAPLRVITKKSPAHVITDVITPALRLVKGYK